MIYFPHSNGANPCATVSLSGILDFMLISNPMPPSMFTVVGINFINTVLSKPISHLFFVRLIIGIVKK